MLLPPCERWQFRGPPLFLQLHHFAELVGFAGITLANDLSRRFEHAHNPAFERVSPRSTRARFSHLPYRGTVPVEFRTQTVDKQWREIDTSFENMARS